MSEFKMFEKLAEILPKLRNQFGLVGLIVMVGAFVAVRKIAPDAVPAQVTAGSVGVTIIIFGQIFYYLKLIPESQRAFFIIIMFLIFCLFMLALVTVTAYQLMKPKTKISQVSVHGLYKEKLFPANTLDDLKLRWSHEGDDRQFEVVLRETLSGKSSNGFIVQSSDHSLVVPASKLKRLWPSPKLDEVYSLRVEFQGEEKLFRFGPFAIPTAIRIIYFLESNKVTVASLADEQSLIDHSFEAKVIAWQRALVDLRQNPSLLTSMPLRGKGMQHFPKDLNRMLWI